MIGRIDGRLVQWTGIPLNTVSSFRFPDYCKTARYSFSVMQYNFTAFVKLQLAYVVTWTPSPWCLTKPAPRPYWEASVCSTSSTVSPTALWHFCKHSVNFLVDDLLYHWALWSITLFHRFRVHNELTKLYIVYLKSGKLKPILLLKWKVPPEVISFLCTKWLFCLLLMYPNVQQSRNVLPQIPIKEEGDFLVTDQSVKPHCFLTIVWTEAYLY